MEKSSNKTFTQLYEELETLVKEFEDGDVDIEDGIEKFKQGAGIAKELQSRLQVLENEIKEVKVEVDERTEDESPDTVPDDYSSADASLF
ncbi:exodeoxyribonuclease VII small subunit [candidate division WWE3 bacterium]|uniref:Exodeoxyribonuclease 7 small subunit n=1 Tax=candidate division WWE3 bacterium TaxID=2053526 RepID=A0A955RS09_UNCKA|nr:exodeoxyribonuclease VII small subunit [candidate division WWE3 bacterium]